MGLKRDPGRLVSVVAKSLASASGSIHVLPRLLRNCVNLREVNQLEPHFCHLRKVMTPNTLVRVYVRLLRGGVEKGRGLNIQRLQKIQFYFLFM